MKNQTNGYIKIGIITFISTLTLIIGVNYLPNKSNELKLINSRLKQDVQEKDMKIITLEEKIKEKQNLVDSINRKYKNCVDNLKRSENELTSLIENTPFDLKKTLNKNPQVLKKELNILLIKKEQLKEEFAKEVTGDNGNIGYGPVAKAIERQLKKVSKRILLLEKKINEFNK